MILNNVQILWKGLRKSYYSKTYTPTDVILFLTYRCTSRCTACNIWKRPVDKSKELTWEQWEPVFRKLAQQGINSVELFGGDALLRKELLFEMIRFCRDHDIKTYFPTNSSSLNEETARQLVEAGLSTIYISLDETTDMHGEVRGIKRHAERVGKSMHWIRKARGELSTPRIECITTVSKLNFQHLEEFAEYAKEAGADAHEFRGITDFPPLEVVRSAVEGVIPEPYFMSVDNESLAYDETQANELLDITQRLWKNRKRYLPLNIRMTNLQDVDKDHLMNLTYPGNSCLFSTTQMVLTPYGEVLPCLYFNHYYLGNLVDEKIEDVWGNQKHRTFCDHQKDGEIPICQYCSIRQYQKNFSDSIRDVAWSARHNIA